MWIFLVFGALIPFVFLFGVFGGGAELALYGLKTNSPLSMVGLIITAIFLIKGITAFGLWKEKDWAIKIGIADAALGIIICTFLMLYPIINPDFEFSFRLELVALIPYLLKFIKIKPE